MPELTSRCSTSLPRNDFCSTMRSTSSVSLPFRTLAEARGHNRSDRPGSAVRMVIAAPFVQVEVAYPRDRLRLHQRNVAGEHQNRVEALQRVARFHHGVSGAALLALEDKVDAGRRQGFTDPSASYPMMAKMFCGGTTPARRRHHMCQQRLAANLVQHLRAVRFQPRAFASGQNCDGELPRFLLRSF